ncbi:UvrD-helicase domain-containing protein [Indioceanicola profundi]|uniref:UvrD-helicase domain-containing protein n=1 Tax=Indioceanicola profundi TaxID=2220096 RepID=UPI000E6AD3AD|nr:UvrD-helicase domain-containing protein [Indioceanicola profundi]
MTVRREASPAERASEVALREVFDCLDSGQSFLLEAGAGAGKTYTLRKALKHLLDSRRQAMTQNRQKIACITFTNVAKDEIERHVDHDPLVHCDTTHGFCWSLISSHQKELRKLLPTLKYWPEKIAEADAPITSVHYDLGYRSIKEGVASIHHDDVIPLAVDLLSNVKFRSLLCHRFPVILIDEYQDTNAQFVSALKQCFLETPGTLQLAFFGDNWQSIYGEGCGKIEHQNLRVVGKRANFRSVPAVVNCLNRMRPDLMQEVADPDAAGSVYVYHSNAWVGTRLKGGHWAGDLPADAAQSALNFTLDDLTTRGWDLAPDVTKILMLTHRGIAARQGYGSLPGVFQYKESFTKKEDELVAFFADQLEPACNFFIQRRYGAMFECLGGRFPAVKRMSDKQAWATALAALLEVRSSGTVGEVIDHLIATGRPSIPENIQKRETLRRRLLEAGDELPRPIAELEKLRSVPYSEMISLARYLDGHSPFETKHGVKGAEFENVIVLLGRGWNIYNFNEMLELSANPGSVPPERLDSYEKNRNLFYVACSRPKTRLALVFTQLLSDKALGVVRDWFGNESILEIAI